MGMGRAAERIEILNAARRFPPPLIGGSVALADAHERAFRP
jgi:hypothetical protein